jgi:hypothetical protein
MISLAFMHVPFFFKRHGGQMKGFMWLPWIELSANQVIQLISYQIKARTLLWKLLVVGRVNRQPQPAQFSTVNPA